MTYDTLLFVILLGIALSADAFAISITYGLVCTNINKKRTLFIALVFGLMQGIMPLCGFWIVECVQTIVIKVCGTTSGVEQGIQAGDILSQIVAWIAFIALIFVGGKMLFDGIKDLKHPNEEKQEKVFSYREVLLFGVLTSIDALATGVALHSVSIEDGSFNYLLSNTATIWLHIVMIAIITFVISLLGVTCASFFKKLFKGKYEIASIIGGII